MNLISKEEIRTLIDQQEAPCMSLYMPTIRAGAQIQQNHIRFKNLLTRAERELSEQGMRKPEMNTLLKPAFETLNDEVFWENQSDGLAIFLSPSLYQLFRFPVDFDEQLVVSNHFYVKPLLPLFSNNARFYILALSQNRLRLFEGTQHSVDEVDLEDAPESLAEALRWDEAEEHLQFHAEQGAPTGGARPEATYHGHGVGTDEAREKENVLRYFQKVDKGLKETFANEHVPLILAGVEYLFPIYQEANTYPYLVEQGIPGNPEKMSAKQLHEKAWEALEPRFEEEIEKAAALYRQQAGMKSGRASDDLTEIIPAAFRGRVGQLFLLNGMEKWGTYDWGTGEVKLQDQPTRENQDLLDLSAVQTFLNDGVIYVVEPDRLPDEANYAAVFRY